MSGAELFLGLVLFANIGLVGWSLLLDIRSRRRRRRSLAERRLRPLVSLGYTVRTDEHGEVREVHHVAVCARDPRRPNANRTRP